VYEATADVMTGVSTPSTEPLPADGTPPVVSLTAPLEGASLSGTVVVTASATDKVGVAGVQFKLNGVNLGPEDTSAPYSVSWNTTATASGSHTLTALARDAAGNSASSAATVIVSNIASPQPVTPELTPFLGSRFSSQGG
jgi:hypothetical protein